MGIAAGKHLPRDIVRSWPCQLRQGGAYNPAVAPTTLATFSFDIVSQTTDRGTYNNNSLAWNTQTEPGFLLDVSIFNLTGALGPVGTAEIWLGIADGASPPTLMQDTSVALGPIVTGQVATLRGYRVAADFVVVIFKNTAGTAGPFRCFAAIRDR